MWCGHVNTKRAMPVRGLKHTKDDGDVKKLTKLLDFLFADALDGTFDELLNLGNSHEKLGLTD